MGVRRLLETSLLTDIIFVLLFQSVFLLKPESKPNSKPESEAELLVAEYDERYREMYANYTEVDWEYQTNITDVNKERLTQSSLELAENQKIMTDTISQFDHRNFKNKTLSRIFSLLTSYVDIGAVKDEKIVEEFANLKSDMQKIYSSGEACRQTAKGTKECLTLQDGLESIMRQSRDLDELTWAWSGWRNSTGKKIGPLYPRYVQLRNIGAQAMGYNNAAEQIQGIYNWPNFEQDVEALYEQIKPLYRNLHSFVKRRLEGKYNVLFAPSGLIHAHMLGNMWAQEWSSLMSLVAPYTDYKDIDLEKRFQEKNYTAMDLVKMAESFFVSLGLPSLPGSFWKKSMFVKPPDRVVACHASAWDMFRTDDVRIKMCINMDGTSFRTIHHELGHTYYQYLYQHLPSFYREGASPAFHESIGDAIAKAVMTPKHLKQIGLLDNYTENKQSAANNLMRSALEDVTFLPFAYIVDKWRWSVFRGETTEDNYNKAWWDLRCKYQGITPPIKRAKDDFDPGSKYHIASGSHYIQYFLSRLLQLELHKALCKASNHSGPLHTCDFHGSKEAGNLLKRVLSLGASRPWPEVMKIISGREKHDASALLDYYKPLMKWLENENAGVDTQWSEKCAEGCFSGASGHSINGLLMIIAYIMSTILNQ